MPTPSAFLSPRLILRAFEPSDMPALQALLNHPALEGLRYLPWGFPDDLPLSAAQVEKIYTKWNEAQEEAHLLKHGFQERGRWRRDSLRRGAYVNTVVFDILRPEWAARQEG